MCHTCGVFVSGRSCKPDYDLIANETSEAAQAPPALAEIAEGTSTEAVIAVGETITETLETIGDKDWFRVELAAGDTVEIELTGVGLTELRDPLLRLRDDQGRILAENDDIRFAIELDSRIIHTVETSGTYFIEADSYLSRYTGDYELSVDVALPPGPVDAIRGVNALEDSETLLVYLAQGGESYSERFNGQNQTFQAEGFNAYEREQIFSVFEHIETFADIDFELTNNRAAADLEIASSNLNGAINGGTLLGYFYFPTSQGDGGYGLLNSSFSGWGSGEGSGLDRGGFMYGVTLHEIGHGLGLAHPHDNGNGSQVLSGVSSSGSLGTFDLNQTVFTTLSYNDGFVTSLDGRPDTFDYGYAASFGTLDIAALQQLYGVNESHAVGNNVYRLVSHNGIGTGYEAIWDTGGRDWIVANGKTPSIIDLRAATLTLSPDGAGHVSSIEAVHGGFTIANGVLIEHARGGDGSDTITGNEVRNFLVGKAGADRLEGGAGDDVLTGGAGADRLSGGTGIDTASYRDSAYGVQVSLDGSAGQGGDAWGDRLSGIERVIGSEKADRLTGATDDDTLDGRDGDDMLRGGAGGDTLRG
ncbi:MAG: M10 family metallopeptidase C-terminal domain-containing protein, partial [Pseudomonadota bacterium]